MKKILKALGYLLGVILLLVFSLFLWGHFQLNGDLDRVQELPAIGVNSANGDLEMGKRIVTIRNGCIHCHGADLGGNVFINDPMMGTVGGSNITSFRLKDRTDEEIARSIKYGLNHENKSLKFMPAAEFQFLSKSDIESAIAYLRSVPAVEKASPEISFGPMAKILYGLGQLPTLVGANKLIDPSLNVQKPEEAATVEFGQYLVQSACIGCHRMTLEGGNIPGGPPDWPAALPLNNLPSVGYTAANFKENLRGAKRPDGADIRQPMAASTARLMSDTELDAIWSYLESVSKK